MREVLEAFVVENFELEHLEDLLSEFNFFEALGAVRVEARHSDFLSFVLNPRESHGLGDVFLTRLLQRVVSRAGSEAASVGAVDLDVWDLSNTQVHRERGNIDILLINETHRFIVVIENKIDTREHSGQLQRYRKWVAQEYQDYQPLFIFLSPDGDTPSDDAYVALEYDLICHILETLLQTRAPTMGHEVRMAVSHYTQMLRRHIMNESEPVALARRIYAKHQKALDFIFEHKPDRQSEIAEKLRHLIEISDRFVQDRFAKTVVNFIPEAWDKIQELRQGQGWTQSGRILLFEFRNQPNRVSLALVIGPGKKEIRQRLHSEARKRPDLFPRCSKLLYPKWTRIMSKEFLRESDIVDADFDQICNELGKKWNSFLEKDLSRISDVVENIDFNSLEKPTLPDRDRTG